jgi:putative MFS transporter
MATQLWRLDTARRLQQRDNQLTDLSPSQRLTALLDDLPLKPIQRWLWVLSTGGTFLDGFVIFILGMTMPLIIAEFRLTSDVVGLIGASLVFGAVFGAGLGGPMADRLGRKKLMLADMIIIAAGAATSALANGFPLLFVGQLLVGVGVGIDFPASSSYVSEVLPKRSRARMMVATIACQSVGMLLAAVIVLLLLKNVHSAQTWRLFLATEGAIALLFFLLRLSEPDSPHWLMTRGRFTEAAQAFLRIMPGAARSSATNYRRWRGPKRCKFNPAFEITRTSDSFLSRLSSSNHACRNPVVPDGYRHLWRRTLHPDYPGCD